MMDIATGQEYYYHYDGLGSVVALSNNNGQVVERYSYDVFGEPTIRDPWLVIRDSSAYGNNRLFTGREYDVETGNYYYRARYYSPEIGRFLQTDPIDYYDSMNLYEYCFNNPVNWVDPWGLASMRIYVRRGQPWGQTIKGAGGHAWIEGKDDYGNRINRGSYPRGLRDDTKRNPTAAIVREYDITQGQYDNLVKGIENYGDDNWRLLSENCVDFVYKAAEDWAGIDIPGSDWGIDYPDKLADDLKKE